MRAPPLPTAVSSRDHGAACSSGMAGSPSAGNGTCRTCGTEELSRCSATWLGIRLGLGVGG